ncbi:hypothetical protein BO99DRAFT_399827 [Aspergillus violaceofuscus CBS 115571]|uniref:Uncharacterized protein n=1 Tax=Aspergillus violaceofuscus (strain CBS 115571) TaxID=1450538 RepID=A0A2V5HL39_ASPV1|nr:hypothetical protein BO99DRAFT_399827 [Aspergillus violaceofuscus CBS 115571]
MVGFLARPVYIQTCTCTSRSLSGACRRRSVRREDGKIDPAISPFLSDVYYTSRSKTSLQTNLEVMKSQREKKIED